MQREGDTDATMNWILPRVGLQVAGVREDHELHSEDATRSTSTFSPSPAICPGLEASEIVFEGCSRGVT